MSEDKIDIGDGIDFTKTITDISISTSYIFGLEQLMVHYISNMDNPGIIKSMFEKFDSIIKGKFDVVSNPLNEQELHLYTLFSLQQLFRAKAYEQGHDIKIDKAVSKDLVEKLLKATLEGNLDEIKKINEEIQKDLS